MKHTDGGGIYGGFTAKTENGSAYTSICLHILKEGPDTTVLRKNEFEGHLKVMLNECHAIL